MAKSRERIRARKLRVKGESINLIAQKLGVSKSSISRWCLDIELTDKQMRSLLAKKNNGGEKGRMIAARNKKKERLERVRYYGLIGEEKVARLSKRELFLVGVALYWAEGSKKYRRVVFANSDPKMIVLFLKWLKKCFAIGVDRVVCHVSINQDYRNRIKDVEKYWSKITGVSLENFNKPSYKKVKNKKFYENFERHYGTLFVCVRRSTNFNYEILGCIEGLRKAA